MFFSLIFLWPWLRNVLTTMCRHAGMLGYGGPFLQSWGHFVVVDHTVNVNSSSLMENIVESRSKVLQQ